MVARILIIEDDPDISDLLSLNIRDMNLVVETRDDGLAGYQLANKEQFDLILLDIMLPNMDGIEICRKLRAEKNYTPILMLTSRNTEVDRVLGLEIGADDYLTKPFSIRELQARIKALLRRVEMLSMKSEDVSDLMTVKNLRIDTAKRSVDLSGRLIELTGTEFDLLVHLARHPGRVFSRSQLLDKVWGYHHSGYEHTVNSHINRLRTKIEQDPSEPQYVLTVWGVGYKFCE